MQKIPTKICTKCKKEKTVHEFHIDMSCASHLKSRCAVCERAAQKLSKAKVRGNKTGYSWGHCMPNRGSTGNENIREIG